MNVDGVLSGHYLIDDRTALLLITLLFRSNSTWLKWERKPPRFFLFAKHPCVSVPKVGVS